jgi:urease beta subunit
VHVDAPFGQDQGQHHLERTPPAPVPAHSSIPGEVRAVAGDISLAPGAPRRTVVLRNTGHRDVWVSSHFPLDQVNPAVDIQFAGDSETGSVPYPDADEGTTAPGDATAGQLTGCRLDLPAGEALLLRPGEHSAHLAVISVPGEAY